MMVGAWPMDYKALKWHPFDVAYETLAVKKEHCVDLYPPNTVLGYVAEKGFKGEPVCRRDFPSLLARE